MTESDMPDAPPTSARSRDHVASVNISLERAVDLLRADVPVRDDWRASLLRELSDVPQPQRMLDADFLPDVPGRVSTWRRSFSVQPLTAVAACLLAMVIGAAGMFSLVNRTAPAAPATASANESLPLVNAANVNNGSDKRQVIRFALVAPGAANVSIVGDFNNWDPKATPLKTARDGSTWLIDMPLTAGRHVYAFVVDGDIVADPSAPRVVDHDFGVQNSVILVGSL